VQSGFVDFFIASSFDIMPQIDGPREWGRTIAYEGAFQNSYKEEYLEEGETISVVCERNYDALEIAVAKQLNGVRIIYRYSYDIKTKQLLENLECSVGGKYYMNSQEAFMIAEAAGITDDELIECRQYLLCDKLLTDWLDVTFSRFSTNRWGRVKFIEVLPSASSK